MLYSLKMNQCLYRLKVETIISYQCQLKAICTRSCIHFFRQQAVLVAMCAKWRTCNAPRGSLLAIRCKILRNCYTTLNIRHYQYRGNNFTFPRHTSILPTSLYVSRLVGMLIYCL